MRGPHVATAAILPAGDPALGRPHRPERGERSSGALESVAFCDEIVRRGLGLQRPDPRARRGGGRARDRATRPGRASWPSATSPCDAARHDWVLALDADERVTPALREEIEALRARGLRPRPATGSRAWPSTWAAGSAAPTGTPTRRSASSTAARGRWQGGLVHESVRGATGRVGRLRGELEHHPYADISDHLRKIDRYTTLWARQAYGAGRAHGRARHAAGAAPGPSSATTC